METEHLPSNFTDTPSTASAAVEWYSQEYICDSLVKYLKVNGYKIYKPNVGENGCISIVASKYFRKEVIEVKGFPKAFFTHTTAQGVVKNSSTLHQAKQWFSDALFNSFTNFGQYYTGDNIMLAIALPNVDRYKAIIERVHDYFTLNDLSFKIYMVNENGDVEVANLNDKIA